MLWSLNHLRHYRIRATDDTLGSVEDLFFDDASWTVRYLVVDTAWLLGRRVLLPPTVLGHPDAVAREFPVSLTKEQVRSSPDIDTAQPVNRQQEVDLHGHYGWIPYWGAASRVLAPDSASDAASGGAVLAEAPGDQPVQRDPHLRSGREVVGYAIAATDEPVGSVGDLLFDEDGWVLRYLVVDTGQWLPGRKVLLAPTWVRELSWAERQVTVNVTRAQVESSPEYNPADELGRDYENRLHEHYVQSGYCTGQGLGKEP